MARDFSDFDFSVRETSQLSAEERRELLHLFENNYRQANPAFLERSLSRLRYLAMAYRDGDAVGFGLAETRLIDLPGLPGQLVNLAGLSCVAPAYRRRGLFAWLELLAFQAGDTPDQPRHLVSGRMAHPAAFRTIGRLATAVPRPGTRPTPRQREIGRAIAETYGVARFDPETFVCIGDGTPIGYPNIEFDLEPDEWRVFEPVNRERGDALLAIAWTPDAPSDW